MSKGRKQTIHTAGNGNCLLTYENLKSANKQNNAQEKSEVLLSSKLLAQVW